MVSRFRNKLNKSYCLVRVEGEWRVAKIAQGSIFITEADGSVRNIGKTDDTDKFKYFSESLEYEHSAVELFAVGDKVKLGHEIYYVVDAGYRGEDGNVKYLIAR